MGFFEFFEKIRFFRLFFIAIIVAIKFQEDRYYNNDYYAKVGGVSLKEINRMEKEFLYLINFRLLIEEETFEKYEEKMKKFEQN